MVDKKTFREKAKQIRIEHLFEVNKVTQRNIQENTLEDLFLPYKDRFPKYHFKKFKRQVVWKRICALIMRIFLEELMHDILNSRDSFEFPNGSVLSVTNVARWKLQSRKSYLREYRVTYHIPYNQFMQLGKPYFVKLYPRWKEIFEQNKEQGFYA